jgi:hypothetical protein
MAIFYASLHAIFRGSNLCSGSTPTFQSASWTLPNTVAVKVLPVANLWHRLTRHLRVCAMTYVCNTQIVAHKFGCLPPTGQFVKKSLIGRNRRPIQLFDIGGNVCRGFGASKPD